MTVTARRKISSAFFTVLLHTSGKHECIVEVDKICLDRDLTEVAYRKLEEKYPSLNVRMQPLSCYIEVPPESSLTGRNPPRRTS